MTREEDQTEAQVRAMYDGGAVPKSMSAETAAWVGELSHDLCKPNADRAVTAIPEIAAEIDRIGQQTIDQMSDYVADFIAKRFPCELPAQMYQILAECIIDAVHDGYRMCEAQAKEESRIILGV